MKVLVTGATGFVGRRLLGLLSSSGFEVVLLSRQPVSGFHTVVCDFVKDAIPVDALDSVDIVFHLAGYAHDTRDASKSEKMYQMFNVDTTTRLAELAVECGVGHFIFMSSVKAGGQAIPGQCMTEEDQGEPDGVYGRSKREAELVLLQHGCDSKMLVSIVRPALVYGPHVKGNLNMMLAGIERGWFPPLPELCNRRSMIHVDDLVRSLLLLAENRHFLNDEGEVFIATDGESYSSRNIYEVMCRVLGRSVPKWEVPKIVFHVASFFHPSIRYKLEKLLGDECYSSEKLQRFGFVANNTLEDMSNSVYSD